MNTPSIVMDLENMQRTYSNILIQYKQSVADYISSLKNEQQKILVSIQGAAYTGTGSAGQSTANTLQDCEAACSSNTSCTGATFVSGKCNLRVGESSLVPASRNSYAIIPKSKEYLIIMENLNRQLLFLNREITNKINSTQPIYNDLIVENNKKSQELIKNYKELETERENIAKLLEQYETLDTTENENKIKTNQNYYSYILLTILAIAVIFLLIKMSVPTLVSSASSYQYGGELNVNAYYILFILILLIIVINLSIKYFSL